MSIIDDSGRIPLPRPSSSSLSSSSASPRILFPGFLSSEHSEAGSSRMLPSPPEASSAIPYLRVTSSSTKKRPPARLNLGQRSSSSSSLGTGVSVQGGLRTGGLERPLGSSGVRRRPSPLELGRAQAIGLDEELQEQRNLDGPLMALSLIGIESGDSLQGELQDLTALRQSVRRNLLLRPVESPLTSSECGSSRAVTPELFLQDDGIPAEHTLSISATLDLLSPRTSSLSAAAGLRQTVILDTRPLGDFLESHLPRSANMSIPSLIFKRFKNSIGSRATSWASLGSFVSTSAGKAIWEGVNPRERVDIVVVGMTPNDETARVLRGMVEGIVEGDAKVLRGGWAAVLTDPRATDMLVSGEQSVESSSSSRSVFSKSLPSPRVASASNFPPPPIPPSNMLRVEHHPSMPSLRPDGLSGGRRNVPTLSLQTGVATSRRPPKLSLNLDQPLRSSTTGTLGNDSPRTSNNLDIPGRRMHPGLTICAPKSPLYGSSSEAATHDSIRRPSPGEYEGAEASLRQNEDVSPLSRSHSNTPWSSHTTARPDGHGHHALPLSPNLMPAGSITARNGMAPFIVSTILPNFLYLGPEITNREEVDALVKLGVKRILNVAIECDDQGELRLKERFERYMKLPMRDMVEESGVAKGMRDACNFLDDARLHSAPTYVHCKAGKSRSVTVVLAYLIHANAWTLKTSYAYVAERRKGISPNIGFVAELMQFEETELGLKQSGGVHGECSGRNTGHGGRNDNEEEQEKKGEKGEKRGNPRHMRESLPPAWAASLDSGQVKTVPLHGEGEPDRAAEEGRRPVGDEREVRKNGQWVHQRRAPVDRTTLQPGRRVSKAGLESLRPLGTTNALGGSTAKPSPRASPSVADGGDKSTTPGVDGRLGWV